MCRAQVVADATGEVAEVAFDELGEVRRVVEPEVGGDAGDGLVGVSQEAADFQGDPFVEDLLGGLAGDLLARPVEGAGAVSDLPGEIDDLGPLVQLLLDELSKRQIGRGKPADAAGASGSSMATRNSSAARRARMSSMWRDDPSNLSCSCRSSSTHPRVLANSSPSSCQRVGASQPGYHAGDSGSAWWDWDGHTTTCASKSVPGRIAGPDPGGCAAVCPPTAPRIRSRRRGCHDRRCTAPAGGSRLVGGSPVAGR